MTIALIMNYKKYWTITIHLSGFSVLVLFCTTSYVVLMQIVLLLYVTLMHSNILFCR